MHHGLRKKTIYSLSFWSTHDKSSLYSTIRDCVHFFQDGRRCAIAPKNPSAKPYLAWTLLTPHPAPIRWPMTLFQFLWRLLTTIWSTETRTEIFALSLPSGMLQKKLPSSRYTLFVMRTVIRCHIMNLCFCKKCTFFFLFFLNGKDSMNALISFYFKHLRKINLWCMNGIGFHQKSYCHHSFNDILCRWISLETKPHIYRNEC